MEVRDAERDGMSQATTPRTELKAVREENKLLNMLLSEEGVELKHAKAALEMSEMAVAKLIREVSDLKRDIAGMREDQARLEAKCLRDQLQAHTQATNTFSGELEQVRAERALLTAQTDIDSHTIRQLQAAVHEALFERDRLSTQLDSATRDRDDVVVQMELLQQHAEELRASNVALAGRVGELEEQVNEYEAESHADFFTRYSRREIAAGRLIPRGLNHPVDGVPHPAAVAHGSTNKTIAAHSSKPDSHKAKAEGAKQPSPVAGSLASHPTTHAKTPQPHGHLRPLGEVPIVDALSGKQVGPQSAAAFNSSLGPAVSRGTVYSDDEDDEESSPASPESGARPTILRGWGTSTRQQNAQGGGGGGDGLPPLAANRFQTLKELKQQQNGDSKNGATSSTAPTLDDVGAGSIRARPKTCPLVVEAVYGEKGVGREKMYLIKYSGVEAEQWTSAEFVDPLCEALKVWRRSRMDRSAAA